MKKNNLLILLFVLLIIFCIINSNKTNSNTSKNKEFFEKKSVTFKARNTGYGRIVSVDDNGNLVQLNIAYSSSGVYSQSITGLVNKTTHNFTLKNTDPKRVSTLKSLTPKRIHNNSDTNVLTNSEY
jgi:hypothetical protein